MNFFEGELAADNGRLLWRSPALSIDVSSYPFAEEPHIGQKAVLGMRPEHIELVALDQAGSPPVLGQATVTLAEPMGASVVLWLDLGGTPMSAMAESHTPHQRGHTLGVRCDARRVSLFGENGQRL